MEKLIQDKNKLVNYLIYDKHFTKEDAEDIYQDAMVICIQKEKFDFNFFFTCLINQSHKKRQENGRHISVPLDDIKHLHQKSCETEYATKEIISLFDPKMKQIIDYKIQGYSHKDISNMTGLTERYISVSVSSAYTKIRKAIS